MMLSRTGSRMCRRGLRRTGLAAMLGVACVGAGPDAAAAVPWQIQAAGVDSDGRKPPHASSVNNGTVFAQYTGLGFQAGSITIAGEIAPTGAPIASAPAELRIMVEKLNTQGIPIETWCSGLLHPQTTALGSVAAVGPVAFDAASLGWISGGQSVRVRFYEIYDDTAGPVPGPDLNWIGVTLTFGLLAPPGPDLGAFVQGPAVTELTTEGTDYQASIALYSSAGDLLAESDGSGTPGRIAAISLDGLPPGEYHLCCAGTGAGFDDGYEVVPGAAGGALVVNHPGGSTTARTHDDSVLWYGLTLEPPSCPADVDGDQAVGVADLLALLAAWGPCP